MRDHQARLSHLELENARLEGDLKHKDGELGALLLQLNSRSATETDIVRLNELVAQLRDERAGLLADLERLRDELKAELRKNRDFQTRIEELLAELRLKDEELARLRNRPRSPPPPSPPPPPQPTVVTWTFYRAAKGDPIDEKLAEVLNGLQPHERPRFEFVRENPGVYTFGTRRIYLRLENGRLIVRVGGGYMTIYEFIEVYDRLETDKQQNRASLSRLPPAIRASPIRHNSPRQRDSARSTGSARSSRSTGRI